jgi:hypothetical protein
MPKCSKHGVIFETRCPVVEDGKLCEVGVLPPDPAATKQTDLTVKTATQQPVKRIA